MTHVCRYWKELALSTPGLWANFGAQPDCEHDIAGMEKWLKLSGSYPLSISLRLDCEDAVAVAAFELILQHKPRWQHIMLDWQLDDYVPRFFSSLEDAAPVHRLPLLETFIIHTSFDIELGDLDNAVGPQIDTLLAAAPRLRTFHWDALQFYTDMEPAEFPRASFGALTELKLTCLLSIDECLGLLARTPLLESCSFNYVRKEALFPYTPVDPALALPPVVLPRLHTLILDTDCSISPFLDALTLPALKRIAIDFRHNIGDLDSPFLRDDFHDWPHGAFILLLTRSMCALASLSLCVPISEGELSSLLRRCAGTLESVTVQGKVGWDLVHESTVRLLTRQVEVPGHTNFPKLRCIRLHDCIVHPLPPHVLADMVHSRLARGNMDMGQKLGEAEVSLRMRPDIMPACDEHRLAAMQTLCGKVGGKLEIEKLLRPARVH